MNIIIGFLIGVACYGIGYLVGANKNFNDLREEIAGYFRDKEMRGLYIDRIARVIIENRTKSGSVSLKGASKAADKIIDIFLGE